MIETIVATQLFVAFVFLYAAIPKLLDMQRFVRAVASYRLLPQPVVRPFALCVPLVELATAAALLGGWKTRVAASAAAAIFALFALAVALNLRRRNFIDCGCGGWTKPAQISWRLVGTDLVLAWVAGCLAALNPPSLAALLGDQRLDPSALPALAMCASLAPMALAATQAGLGVAEKARRLARALPTDEAAQ